MAVSAAAAAAAASGVVALQPTSMCHFLQPTDSMWVRSSLTVVLCHAVLCREEGEEEYTAVTKPKKGKKDSSYKEQEQKSTDYEPK